MAWMNCRLAWYGGGATFSGKFVAAVQKSPTENRWVSDSTLIPRFSPFRPLYLFLDGLRGLSGPEMVHLGQ